MSVREMKPVIVLGLTCLLFAASVSPVEAQEGLRGRFALHVNFGYQFGSNELREEIEFRAYGETARFLASHEITGGGGFDAGGFVQVWEQLSIGATFSQTERTDTTTVTGTVPHPIQFGLDRSVSEVVNPARRERATHVHIAWLIPLPQVEKLDIRVMAGPTYFNVTQGSVIGVTVSETGPPFETVNVDVVTGDLVKNGWGGHIGADISYMIHTNVGIGGFVRFTGGSVDLPRGDTAVTTNVGGFQTGGGIRFRF